LSSIQNKTMANLKLDKIENTDTYGKYEIYPLEKGFGNTFATPIRRILLSSIQGTAISRVKVKGVDHEFSSLKGMKEDVLKLVLSLQKVIFKLDGSETEKILLKVKGAKEVKASDIKVPGNVTILNPDFVLANLTDKSADLEVEATIVTGYGFEVADDESRNSEPGIIPVPKSFSPVIKVNVSVESTRVAQRTDYEKIVLEVWTNGAITPDEAIRDAVKKLLDRATYINALEITEE